MEQLSKFDFGTLHFIPMLESDVAEEGIRLLTSNLKLLLDSRVESPNLEVKMDFSIKSNLDITINGEQPVDQLKEKAISILDFKIEEELHSFPQIYIFKKYLQDNGKIYMGDIEEEDFVSALEKTDITERSISILRNGWIYFLSLLENEKELNEYLITRIFKDLPKGKKLIAYFKDNGIHHLSDLLFLDFRDFEIKSVGKSSLDFLYNSFIKSLENPIIKSYAEVPLDKYFYNFVNKLDERYILILRKRSEGYTLNELGVEFNLSRERIRQIENKAIAKSRNFIKLIFDSLKLENDGVIDRDRVIKLLGSCEDADLFIYLVGKNKIAHYSNFSKKIIAKDALPYGDNKKLNELATSLIGDGIFYSEYESKVTNLLYKNELSIYTAGDFRKYLLANGYVEYGNFITKKNISYAKVCYHAILRNFKLGIDFSPNDPSGDIKKLRNIINQDYPGFELPEDNRNLITRISSIMILCGVGRYCPIEKVFIDYDVLSKIKKYIDNNKQSSFLYDELFSAFKGRLLASTSIDNSHFLHGILQHFYPNEYNYEKSLLSKKGVKSKSLSLRVEELAKEKGGIITRSQVLSKFSGIKRYTIMAALDKAKYLTKWSNDEYIHISKLSCTVVEKNILVRFLVEILNKNNGYASAQMVYDDLVYKTPRIFKNNNIKNSDNLFYFLNIIFNKSLLFSFPHITSPKFPVDPVNNVALAKYFLRNHNIVTKLDLDEIVEKYKWAIPSNYNLLFHNIVEQRLRISKDMFIHEDAFSLSENKICAIKKALKELIPDSGYLSLFSITEYDLFPNIKYEWNDFLVATIVKKFIPEIKIIEPTTSSKEKELGIMISDMCVINTFDQLLANVMKIDGKKEIMKDDIHNYLKTKGLLFHHIIPKEIYSGKYIKYKNKKFLITEPLAK